MMAFFRGETAAAAPSAAETSEGAYEEHNAWLQAQREQYQQRLSCASEYASEGRLSTFASEYASEGRHSQYSAYDEQELDVAAAFGEEMGYHGLVSGCGSLMLEDDDFDEGPVYRSLTMVQPSGGNLAQLQDQMPASKELTQRSQPSLTETVDALWLSGANPPLIRRQRAFIDNER